MTPQEIPPYSRTPSPKRLYLLSGLVSRVEGNPVLTSLLVDRTLSKTSTLNLLWTGDQYPCFGSFTLDGRTRVRSEKTLSRLYVPVGRYDLVLPPESSSDRDEGQYRYGVLWCTLNDESGTSLRPLWTTPGPSRVTESEEINVTGPYHTSGLGVHDGDGLAPK